MMKEFEKNRIPSPFTSPPPPPPPVIEQTHLIKVKGEAKENCLLHIVIVGKKDNQHYKTKININEKYIFKIKGILYQVTRENVFEDASLLMKIKNKIAWRKKCFYAFFFEGESAPIDFDSEENALPKESTGEGMIEVTSRALYDAIHNNVLLDGLKGLVPKPGGSMFGHFNKKTIAIIAVGAICAVVVAVLVQQGIIPLGGATS